MGGKREKFLKKSKETVTKALRSRDMLLMGVTKTVDDLDKAINQLYERLEDWYGIYFPEMKTEDYMKYCQLVMIIDKSDVEIKEIAKLVGQKKAEELVSKASSSLGAKLEPKDLNQCQSLAKSIMSLDNQRSSFEDYQKELAKELCPNMSAVAGSVISAKLVSHVGSLSKLAMLPSSTIQVLGAEKALFKHLKNRKVKPPKHGIIFQHAKISSSPKKVRGKIARVLANKISIASKADAFTKRDISDDVRKGLDERIVQIMEDYWREKSGKGKS